MPIVKDEKRCTRCDAIVPIGEPCQKCGYHKYTYRYFVWKWTGRSWWRGRIGKWIEFDPTQTDLREAS